MVWAVGHEEWGPLLVYAAIVCGILSLVCFLWPLLKRIIAGTGVTQYEAGSEVFVNCFYPACGSTYTMIIQVINNGPVGGSVTGTFINADGLNIGSGTIIDNLSAGGNRRLTSMDIEQAIGVTLASMDRPRLKITSEARGITLQAYRKDVRSGEIKISQ